MKKLFAILFLLAAILSCKDDVTKMKNRDLIPREKFIDILAEVHLADVLTNGPAFSRKFSPSDTLELNQGILDKYHVTKAEFDSTVSMYVRQPEVFIKVYDEVLLKLNYILDTLRKKNPQNYREAIEK